MLFFYLHQFSPFNIEYKNDNIGEKSDFFWMKNFPSEQQLVQQNELILFINHS